MPMLQAQSRPIGSGAAACRLIRFLKVMRACFGGTCIRLAKDSCASLDALIDSIFSQAGYVVQSIIFARFAKGEISHRTLITELRNQNLIEADYLEGFDSYDVSARDQTTSNRSLRLISRRQSLIEHKSTVTLRRALIYAHLSLVNQFDVWQKAMAALQIDLESVYDECTRLAPNLHEETVDDGQSCTKSACASTPKLVLPKPLSSVPPPSAAFIEACKSRPSRIVCFFASSIILREIHGPIIPTTISPPPAIVKREPGEPEIEHVRPLTTLQYLHTLIEYDLTSHGWLRLEAGAYDRENLLVYLDVSSSTKYVLFLQTVQKMAGSIRSNDCARSQVNGDTSTDGGGGASALNTFDFPCRRVCVVSWSKQLSVKEQCARVEAVFLHNINEMLIRTTVGSYGDNYVVFGKRASSTSVHSLKLPGPVHDDRRIIVAIVPGFFGLYPVRVFNQTLKDAASTEHGRISRVQTRIVRGAGSSTPRAQWSRTLAHNPLAIVYCDTFIRESSTPVVFRVYRKSTTADVNATEQQIIGTLDDLVRNTLKDTVDMYICVYTPVLAETGSHGRLEPGVDFITPDTMFFTYYMNMFVRAEPVVESETTLVQRLSPYLMILGLREFDTDCCNERRKLNPKAHNADNTIYVRKLDREKCADLIQAASVLSNVATTCVMGRVDEHTNRIFIFGRDSASTLEFRLEGIGDAGSLCHLTIAPNVSAPSKPSRFSVLAVMEPRWSFVYVQSRASFTTQINCASINALWTTANEANNLFGILFESSFFSSVLCAPLEPTFIVIQCEFYSKRAFMYIVLRLKNKQDFNILSKKLTQISTTLIPTVVVSLCRKWSCGMVVV